MATNPGEIPKYPEIDILRDLRIESPKWTINSLIARLNQYKDAVERDMVDKRDNHGWTNPILLACRFEAKMEACDDLIAELHNRLARKRSLA